MLLGTAFALTFGMFFMSGCSDSKQAQKHFNKFIKHGGKLSFTTDTLIIKDTIKGKDRKDSIVYQNVAYNCPEWELPKTRFEVRNERKSKEDSLKYAFKMAKAKYDFTIDSLNKVIKLYRIEKKVRKIESKQVIKQTKAINQKAFKWYHWVLISIGGIILLVIGFMVGKFLRL